MDSQNFRLTSAFRTLLAICLVACGGPAIQFDAVPAPAWTQINAGPDRDAGGKGGPRPWRAVGSATASLDVIRDAALALDDGKAKLAQVLSSEVSQQSSDSSWASAQAGERKEGQLITQHLEVRSDVRLEGALAVANFRDASSGRHLVLVSLDVSSWRSNVIERLSQALDAGERRLALLENKPEDRATRSLAEFARLQAVGAQLSADARLLSVLGDDKGLQARTTGFASRWQRAGEALHDKVRVWVHADQALTNEVRRFATELGLRLANTESEATLVVTAKAVVRFARTDTIGKRQEQVYEGGGEVSVRDLSGVIPDWSVTLTGVSVGDPVAASAEQKALGQASSLLVSKWRSKVRLALE